MSYKPEVLADNSGVWVGNALRFGTEEEATTYVKDLERRWLLVQDTRVVTSEDPVNSSVLVNEGGGVIVSAVME